jgi:Xaa-Pro dipeptidase
MRPRQQRALEAAERAHTDGVLAVTPAAVTWLTGLARDLDGDSSPFSAPPMALVLAGEAPKLIVSDDDDRPDVLEGIERVTYEGYTLRDSDPLGAARSRLHELSRGRRLLCEVGHLPAAVARDLDVVDGTSTLADARAIKDDDEIEALRAAVRLCDAGIEAARASISAGMTELDLWAAIRAAIESRAGERTPIMADLISGPRTAGIDGSPTLRELQPGDLVLCDLVPRYRGYWGDSCVTLAVDGELGSDVIERHRAVTEALEEVVARVGPGIRASDLDGPARQSLGYPHHTGHGLGTCWHEAPRIVPDNDVELRPGMVIALEPGHYSAEFGVRVEQVVLVTDGGGEVLSAHSTDL